MQTIDEWLDEYGESHLNPVNKAIHRLAVPVIALDVLGLVHALPVPGVAIAVTMLALVYYVRLSPPLALGMGVLATIGLLLLDAAKSALGVAFVPVLIAVFIAAWAAQFYGHSVEGRKPSFVKDLQFLLIGPLWLLADAYRRLGVFDADRNGLRARNGGRAQGVPRSRCGGIDDEERHSDRPPVRAPEGLWRRHNAARSYPRRRLLSFRYASASC